jgi:ABC-type multidrug transport system fused ATPase/permease subunit
VALGDLKTLEFDDVSFTHASASAPALAGCDVRRVARPHVAFVGPSGAARRRS